MYRLKYKIWLDRNGKVFGEGPYQLLSRTGETGSLSTAAREMGMSYSQAHTLIKKLEEKLGFPLLISKVGGTGGGGSSLTREAEILMDKYRGFSDECKRTLEDIFARHFSD